MARQVASVSEGNYREALQLVQHADEDWQSLLRDWLNAIMKTGPIAQTKWVEEISKLGREKQKQFLTLFQSFAGAGHPVRNSSGNETNYLPEKERDFAEQTK